MTERTSIEEIMAMTADELQLLHLAVVQLYQADIRRERGRVMER